MKTRLRIAWSTDSSSARTGRSLSWRTEARGTDRSAYQFDVDAVRQKEWLATFVLTQAHGTGPCWVTVQHICLPLSKLTCQLRLDKMIRFLHNDANLRFDGGVEIGVPLVLQLWCATRHDCSTRQSPPDKRRGQTLHRGVLI
jgi:hypothetical protein